jgi:lipid A ethanolaminephosphotransferase
LSRRGRQERIGLPEEPLPSYLTRQGVKTIVHVNNTGLPRIKVDDFLVGSQLKQICNADFCAERFEYTCSSGMCDDIFPDGFLLSGVEDIAQAALSEPTFLLLHMGGSHGPNYFQKYPKRFSTFDPVCTNKYLPMCDQEGLRNAYDNTLIYTDAVLAELSSILASIEGLNATILYTSDLGQSLGEDGIYAHAASLSSAPKYQLSIPFFIWQSNGAKREITNPSVAAHDAIFHTILGQFGFINGGVYRADRDLFAPKSN